MSRTRAWRRFKNFTKARRKQKIDHFYGGTPWYSNLHQYSKNKIHCSCPICSCKRKNQHYKHPYYAPAYNPTIADMRRDAAMDADEFDYERKDMKYVKFYGDDFNTYEEYLAFSEDEYSEEELNEMADEYALLNAENWQFLTDESYTDEEFYEKILSNSRWEYITKEEYMENTNEEF